MKRAAHQFMYLSLAAVLLAVLFVMQPADQSDVKNFQSSVKQQVVSAASELWGDSNPVEPLRIVWNSLDLFYQESATQTIALIRADDQIVEWALAFNSDYQVSRQIVMAPFVTRPPYEQPLYNIVPMSDAESVVDPYFSDDLAYLGAGEGQVAGESVEVEDGMEISAVMASPPAQRQVEWITLHDSITGVPYCVSVFNGELNSYPGTCARDMEVIIYEN